METIKKWSISAEPLIGHLKFQHFQDDARSALGKKKNQRHFKDQGQVKRRQNQGPAREK